MRSRSTDSSRRRRSPDWVQVDQELRAFFNDEAHAMSTFLNGRRMYELMPDYWRHRCGLGLIDEYHLFVQPVILGAGKPFFSPLDKHIGLRLVETPTFGSGVVDLRFELRNAT